MNTVTRAVNWRAVGFFVLISFGLAYALDAVLLSTLGLAHFAAHVHATDCNGHCLPVYYL